MKCYRLLIGLLPLTLVGACGGDDDDDGGSGIPFEELPEAYAEAACEAFSNCLGPVLDIFLAGEDCVANTTAQVEENFVDIEVAIEDGRVEYHAKQVAACLSDLRSRTCETLQERGGGPCDAVFAGTKEPGESCSLDEECAGDAFCDFGATCPGTCRKLAAEGEACNEDDDCASGLVCSDVMEVCEKPAGPGDLCLAGNPDCQLGYLCAGANEAMNQPGNCRSYDELLSAGEGDPCDPTNAVLCQEGLTCQLDAIAVPLEWRCAPKVGSGDSCRPAFPQQCPDDEYCNVTPEMLGAGMLDGTCEPRPGSGEPCADDNLCAPNLRCDGGTCRRLTELGGSCVSDAVCYSGRCVDGQCVSSNSCE